MAITVNGASDDLIEVEGDIREEFTYEDTDKEGDLLAFSDGTVLRVQFGAVWRITPVVRGNAVLTIKQCVEDDNDDGEYTDVATLDGDIRWVVQGVALAKKQGF